MKKVLKYGTNNSINVCLKYVRKYIQGGDTFKN